MLDGALLAVIGEERQRRGEAERLAAHYQAEVAELRTQLEQQHRIVGRQASVDLFTGHPETGPGDLLVVLRDGDQVVIRITAQGQVLYDEAAYGSVTEAAQAAHVLGALVYGA